MPHKRQQLLSSNRHDPCGKTAMITQLTSFQLFSKLLLVRWLAAEECYASCHQKHLDCTCILKHEEREVGDRQITEHTCAGLLTTISPTAEHSTYFPHVVSNSNLSKQRFICITLVMSLTRGTNCVNIFFCWVIFLAFTFGTSLGNNNEYAHQNAKTAMPIKTKLKCTSNAM